MKLFVLIDHWRRRHGLFDAPAAPEASAQDNATYAQPTPPFVAGECFAIPSDGYIGRLTKRAAGGSQGAVNTPPEILYALTNSFRIDAGASRGVAKVDTFTTMLKVDTVPLVASLLCICRPYDIGRAIRSVVIKSFKRMSPRWTKAANVFHELFEAIQPFAAHRDSTTAVAVVRAITGLATTHLHLVPEMVDGRVRQSVFQASCARQFSRKAATASGLTGTQSLCRYIGKSAADTAAAPVDARTWTVGTSEHSQPSEHLTAQIKSTHFIDYNARRLDVEGVNA